MDHSSAIRREENTCGSVAFVLISITESNELLQYCDLKKQANVQDRQARV